MKLTKDEFFSLLENGELTNFSINGVKFYARAVTQSKVIKRKRFIKNENEKNMSKKKAIQTYNKLKNIKDIEKLQEVGQQLIKSTPDLYKGSVRGVYNALLKLLKLRSGLE